MVVTVSILVPFRGGCPWREKAWDYVEALYRREHPDWELVAGAAPDGEWSKGAAVADALGRAASDELVIADADCFTGANTLRTAVDLLDELPWVVPHRTVYRLHRRATQALYDGTGRLRRGHLSRPRYVGVQGGGIVVLRRQAYEEVGGIDPRFRGWGGEDLSFGWALETLVGSGHRIEGDLWHLWHPHAAPKKNRGSPESEALAGRYREARHVPERMRALVEEAAA